MNTTHLYRSLTINERKQRNIHTFKKVDIQPAVNFWNQILDGCTITNINDILEEFYDTNSIFLENNFELNANSEFKINDNWFHHISQQLRSSKFIEDPEFNNMNLSDVPFYAFYEPYLKEFYFNFFHNEIKHLDNNISYTCKNDIIKYFIDMLYTISHKTLILEINSLRLMGKLKGNNPEERYKSYSRILQEDNIYKKELFEEYPVLFRLISTKIINFKNFLLEIFTNFKKDKHILEKDLNIDPKTKIKHLHLGSGDSHQNGKTVTILEFENGQKVVYKPRSLAIDVEFQKFLRWVNLKNTTDIKLKTINVIDNLNYGWAEYVFYEDCKSESDISKFYNRVGQLLGILHIMNATDFHYENIISKGEHPVLIDLESLFHHTISPDHSPTKSEVLNKALRLLNDSVLSTGLIPNRTLRAEDATDFDLSGIGNTQNEQEVPIKMGVVTGQYTDEIKIIKKNGKLLPGLNTPKLIGKELNIGDYLEEIKSGFIMVYTTFSKNKTEVKQQVSSFQGKEIRKIFRDTMKYSAILNLSYHPDFMRNQIDREVLLNRLRVQEDSSIKRVVDFEIVDLLEGDIPYFTSTLEGTSISSSSNVKIENFYYSDGLTLSLNKIDRLCEEDLNHQISIITATISAVYSDSDIKLLHFNDKEIKNITSDNLIKKTEEVAELLLDNAITHESDSGKELCWVSMVTKGGNENTWVYSVTGPGLYDGNPGIALYFSYLWKVTGKKRFKEATYATINPIRKLMPELIEPENVNLGGYLGISGIVYSLHHIGEVFNDHRLKEEAISYARNFTKFVKQDVVYDLIGGSSGALMVILNLYEQYQEKWMLDIAEELCLHLIKHAKPQNQGISWIPHSLNKEPYIGFSHGNAGIASALARFSIYKNSSKLEEVIQQAIEYENTFFNEEKGNWFSSHLQSFVIAWCHGAHGILLSRCLLKENNIKYKYLEIDVIYAFNTTVESQTRKSYSFCYGDLGLVDALMVTNEKLYGNRETTTVENFREKVISAMFSGKHIQADINSVGLLNGIAGIGYSLLRLANPSIK